MLQKASQTFRQSCGRKTDISRQTKKDDGRKKGGRGERNVPLNGINLRTQGSMNEVSVGWNKKWKVTGRLKSRDGGCKKKKTKI